MRLGRDLPSKSLLLSQHRGQQQHKKMIVEKSKPPQRKCQSSPMRWCVKKNPRVHHLRYHLGWRAAVVVLSKHLLMHFSSRCVPESAGLRCLLRVCASIIQRNQNCWQCRKPVKSRDRRLRFGGGLWRKNGKSFVLTSLCPHGQSERWAE